MVIKPLVDVNNKTLKSYNQVLKILEHAFIAVYVTPIRYSTFIFNQWRYIHLYVMVNYNDRRPAYSSIVDYYDWMSAYIFISLIELLHVWGAKVGFRCDTSTDFCC
ncbi:hypothetical protein KQX54_011465 [Cotesia glomerata]|uniref:Very-long-chain (3R)-3-hydroxyacyl-CoA dehydratase n=1 Tax=Cotesia glomerata TaxID=32391 RepID=A0AAV7IJ78_COTGL|nr:hypothetical protein KQX54_011465 [Cotesia glomerata]